MSERYYVTTPIYYVNDIPHIGHAYTTIAADVLARYHRLLGHDVFFLTGTDEHGQKVEKAATEKGRSPKEHADFMVGNFRTLWSRLNISYDAFIRTTDDAHVRTVQGLLRMLWDRGEIEKRSYAGWYCTPDERFWTEKDLVGGNCPDCGRPVEQIDEENYFFLMSKYQDQLISHIERHHDYILPETRRNEVLGFLRHNRLGDLCISRPKKRLSWGIPLPFDNGFVTYVWFDALVNYFSATRYLVNNSNKSSVTSIGEEAGAAADPLVTRHSSLVTGKWWPAHHHLVGKDILTTHAVYWSTMLMALNLPLPGTIFAHGWWTVEGKKMSKSVGNVVDPNEMVEKYGVDTFRYFLLREVPFGLDGDFSEDALVNRINIDLANDLGNLLSRFLAMAEKYIGGRLSLPLLEGAGYSSFSYVSECHNAISYLVDDVNHTHWSRLHFNVLLEHIWGIVSAANMHIARNEPWKMVRSNPEGLKSLMFELWNGLRLIAVNLYPFMPETAAKMWKMLGMRDVVKETRDSSVQDGIPQTYLWEWFPAYEILLVKGGHLFPRIEKAEKPGKAIPHAGSRKEETVEETNLITIQDFAKVQLKIGVVLSAERVKKSEKLIRLEVDTGEQRQIVAGIGNAYAPEELVGRKVAVVTNLQPAKLMGVESQGMLLAATGADGKPVFLTPEKDVEPGSRIK